LVKSLKARLEVAREKAEKNKASNPSSNPKQQQHHQHHHHGNKHHHKGHHNKNPNVDLEQAKILKRNYHGDEYDDYANDNLSVNISYSILFYSNRLILLQI
jgi:hypothetical protein